MNITVHTKKIVTIQIDADDAWELCAEMETIPISGPVMPLLSELYDKIMNENLQ